MHAAEPVWVLGFGVKFLFWQNWEWNEEGRDDEVRDVASLSPFAFGWPKTEETAKTCTVLTPSH